MAVLKPVLILAALASLLLSIIFLASNGINCNIPYLDDFDSHQLTPALTEPSRPYAAYGEEFVDRAFNQTFSHLVKACGRLEQDNSLLQCLRRLYEPIKQPKSENSSSWPWWFQTMIRDASNHVTGLFGPWHVLQFPDPLMQLCVYEKGGTKNWRAVHCEVMQSIHNASDKTLTTCYTLQGPLAKENAKKSVFLRDPLERFLSAFLDKCATNHRISQTHCQPNVIFRSNETDHVADYLQNTKTLFEIFVDTSPLKWDLHFLPLSLYCGGLYQRIQEYDFVGMMNEGFYLELGRFLDHYDSPVLSSKVRRAFQLQGKENSTNHGTERQAALHVWDYYTPYTIRRVLQYTAIDYKLLNLSVPPWAHDMLKRDDTFRH